MCTSRLVLLQVLFLMLRQGVRPQPSFSPSGPVPTAPDPGPGSGIGAPASPSAGTESARAEPELSQASPTVATSSAPAPANNTVDLTPASPLCICDLTPGTCDINCCCDRDCHLTQPLSVFSFCLPGSVRSSSWRCVDNSLIFRSNTPFPSRVFRDSNGISQFCVQVNNSKLNYFQKLQKVNATNFEALSREFGGESFTPTFQSQSPPSSYYKAGDPILTYFPRYSALSLLRQPAGVGAGGFCAESNPAGFLESKSTTCAHFFKNLSKSCTADPALNAASYYNFTVLKVGVPGDLLLKTPAQQSLASSPWYTRYAKHSNNKVSNGDVTGPARANRRTTGGPLPLPYSHVPAIFLQVPRGMNDLEDMKFQVPVTLVSQADSPLLAGNTCRNVVSKVIYEIETNGTFGIQKVSVAFEQINLTVEPGISLQQHFIIHFRAFQQSTAAAFGPRSGNPGYIVGKPLLTLTGERSHSMTLLQSQGDGICSIKRPEVQFGVNMKSGCKFRPQKMNCSDIQEEVYQILHGTPKPEQVAVFGNAHPAQKGEWTRILSRNCDVSAVHCTSCCVIPVSLEIQVLWAFIGLQSNPQAHVAGARFLYHCQEFPEIPEVSLTTVVTFVDITQKPEPPRGQPRADWKLPFDFFFPFKVAFSSGTDFQKGSVSPIFICCLLLLGVINLENT